MIERKTNKQIEKRNKRLEEGVAYWTGFYRH